MSSLLQRIPKVITEVNTRIFTTEGGGAVVALKHWYRIREAPSSNPGAPSCGSSQSPRTMRGWIFITTIHLTIIHQINKSYILNQLTYDIWITQQ